MPLNYQNTQLYELIEHDTQGNPVVYRGHTTQPLHKRLAQHRRDFKQWKKGKSAYCSSYEVLKHGPARIELVRAAPCFTKKEASRVEGLFIRELPTCVNIRKNKYANQAERYEANKETILAKHKEYHHANKETANARRKEHHKANKETANAKAKAYNQANKETLKAKAKAYYQTNKETISAKLAEKIQCECGAVISRSNLSHRKTWKHFCDFIHI
jgi:hypothetical protein